MHPCLMCGVLDSQQYPLQVAEAAVIAVPHQKWTERPLLVVVPTPGAKPNQAAMLEFLQVKPLQEQIFSGECDEIDCIAN